MPDEHLVGPEPVAHSYLASPARVLLPSTEIGEDAFCFDAHECGLGTWSR